MKNLIYDFLNYQKNINFRSNQVLLHYKYDLLNLRQFLLYQYGLVEIDVSEITMKDCIAFIENYREKRNAKKNTLSGIATSQKQFFKYLQTIGYKLQFSFDQLPIISKERKPYDMMHKEEYEAMMQAPLLYEEVPILAERNQLLIEIPYKTGLRRAELLRCTFDNFRSENRQFQILGKGGYYDRVFFPKELGERVHEYEAHLKEYTKRRFMEINYLFVGLDNANRGHQLEPKYVNNVFNKYSDLLMKDGKLTRRIHPHMERHAFATNCVYAGLSQQATTRLMRHRDPKTTEGYYHMNDTRLKSQFDMIK